VVGVAFVTSNPLHKQHVHINHFAQKTAHLLLYLVHIVNSGAQWLGRRSLAGGLSPIYAWSMADMWPLRA